MNIGDAECAAFPRVPSVFALVGGSFEVGNINHDGNLLLFCNHGLSSTDMTDQNLPINSSLQPLFSPLFPVGSFVLVHSQGNVPENITILNVLEHIKISDEWIELFMHNEQSSDSPQPSTPAESQYADAEGYNNAPRIQQAAAASASSASSSSAVVMDIHTSQIVDLCTSTYNATKQFEKIALLDPSSPHLESLFTVVIQFNGQLLGLREEQHEDDARLLPDIYLTEIKQLTTQIYDINETMIKMVEKDSNHPFLGAVVKELNTLRGQLYLVQGMQRTLHKNQK